jgi:uncharacterized membrane protein
MKKWILWTALGTLAAAVIVHMATLNVIPKVIMNVAMSKFSVNELQKGTKTTAEVRQVVRPCPDLVYSIVCYNVSNGPLLLTAPVPADTYWSVSLYDQDSDNYFVINDRQVKSNPYSLLLVRQGTKYENPTNAQVVFSPNNRGILLVRYLLVSDDKFDDLVKVQNQASIQMVSAQ